MSTDKSKAIYEAYTQGQLYRGDSVHESKPDMINSPPHYKNGKIECIDAMEAMLSPEEFVGYLRGNAFKYLWRYQHKGKAHEDLQKAQWYLARLVFVHNPK